MHTHTQAEKHRERETGTGKISVENSLMVYLKSYMYVTTCFIYSQSSQLRTTKANTRPSKVLIEMFIALLLQQQMLRSNLSVLQETHTQKKGVLQCSYVKVYLSVLKVDGMWMPAAARMSILVRLRRTSFQHCGSSYAALVPPFDAVSEIKLILITVGLTYASHSFTSLQSVFW